MKTIKINLHGGTVTIAPQRLVTRYSYSHPVTGDYNTNTLDSLNYYLWPAYISPSEQIYKVDFTIRVLKAERDWYRDSYSLLSNTVSLREALENLEREGVVLRDISIPCQGSVFCTEMLDASVMESLTEVCSASEWNHEELTCSECCKK